MLQGQGRASSRFVFAAKKRPIASFPQCIDVVCRLACSVPAESTQSLPRHGTVALTVSSLATLADISRLLASHLRRDLSHHTTHSSQVWLPALVALSSAFAPRTRVTQSPAHGCALLIAVCFAVCSEIAAANFLSDPMVYPCPPALHLLMPALPHAGDQASNPCLQT